MNRPLLNSLRSLFSKNDIERNEGEACSIVEVLESRVFLSGNVLARVAHGNLNIKGDAAANVIVMDQTGLGSGQVRITGANGTTVNGQGGAVILSGVKGNILVSTGDGADITTLHNLSLGGNVVINAQKGVKTLSLSRVQIAKNLTIRNGLNLGNTTIANTTVNKNLTIKSGAGAGQISLQTLNVRQNTKIATGKNADVLSIDDSTFHGAFKLDTGRGADGVQIETNGDSSGPPTSFDGSVAIGLGADDDTLQLGIPGQSGNLAAFAGKTRLDSGAGHDSLRNFNATFVIPPQVKNLESDIPIPDTTAPTVSSTDPADGATSVALNRAIAATFSEPMAPSTITAAHMTATGPGSTPVQGTVTYVGTTATFTPTSDLAPNTTFTVTIDTGAEDLAGNPLASDKVWTFTTGAAPDITAPTVSSTDPAAGATGVALNKAIVATFSETMDPSTISNTDYTLKGPGNTAVAGTVTIVGTTATFTPTSDLAAHTLFTATITTAAKDLAGNALASAKIWTFTTGAAPDIIAPTVSSTDPATGATGVALNKAIVATFSETMDATTITNVTYTLKGPGNTAVAGAVTNVGSTATFTPTLDLAANTSFTATITTAAKDLAGNAIAVAKVWTFTTGAAPDITAPTVSSTDPAAGATGVALNKAIAATFSESMDATTITNVTYTLKGPGNTAVAGAVTYVGTTATFTPTSDLAANTTFTATISTAAKDLAGNALAANKIWTFTTGATPDTTPPILSSNDPANGSTGTALNKAIAVTFSESMDPTTITTATYTLQGPGSTFVAGTVTYAGTTATFTPTSDLASNTLYTATITTGAKDLAGNAIVVDAIWTFTTGATPDTTAPTVSSTDPLAGASGVAVNKAIAATFSETMDSSTITNVTYTLKGPGNTAVAGAVTYVGTIATFTPTSNLAPNTLFTATISAGAEDLAGNALASDKIWTFTTGATPDTTAPTVLSTNPADNETNVAINQSINATFSETMDPTTISTATFTVTAPGNIVVAGTVNYDSPSKIASFTPLSDLDPNTVYTATIAGAVNGAADLAGNPLASDETWTFMTGTQSVQTPVDLGAAGTFAVMAAATTTGSANHINGDVGLHPGSSQGFPTPEVNGTIHVNDSAIAAAQADLLAAYNDAVNRSTNSVSLVGNMGGMTFFPGLYTNSSTVMISGSGSGNIVTLDAQGDPNAIFIFQMGSTLTTGPGAQVVLINGAKANNIFWQVGSSATLDTTTMFEGNVLAAVSITVNNGSVIHGRLLAGVNNVTGAVDMNASTITVPSA